jgi:hypothetical protein
LNSRKSPIQIPEYTVNGVIDDNKFANGGFDTGLGNFLCWTAVNNCNASWMNNVLDGGSIQIGFQPQPPGLSNLTLLYQSIGAISSGKSYKLNFSLIGSNDNVSVGVYLRNSQSPWNKLSETRYAKISGTRTENEFVFSDIIASDDASLTFEIYDQNVSYGLDNINLKEADVTFTNPNDHFRFEYNPNGTDKRVDLDGDYIDVKNNQYSNSLTLAPYSSIVLIKQSGGNKVKQPGSVRKSNQVVRTTVKRQK